MFPNSWVLRNLMKPVRVSDLTIKGLEYLLEEINNLPTVAKGRRRNISSNNSFGRRRKYSHLSFATLGIWSVVCDGIFPKGIILFTLGGSRGTLRFSIFLSEKGKLENSSLKIPLENSLEKKKPKEKKRLAPRVVQYEN